MEHLEFFELPADPFQNDADARFYYESAPQKRARLRLLRGIHQKKSLSLLLGGPGLGKTTLAHVVLRTLEAKDYAAHYLSIPHEACSEGWLLPNVARGFGVPAPAQDAPRLIEQIHTQLVAITTARRTPVLLIDEAQLFRNREAMEEFRGLLNLTHEGRKLLSLALFGLPELTEILKLDAPLAQRVEVRVEMTPMDWLESQAYVAHRLRLAGAAQAVFAPDALEALFRWSGGVPRILNTLADNALFEGFLAETRPVDSAVVQVAAEALGLARASSDSVPNIPPIPAPAPDLLAATNVEPPRPERPRETMPVAKPSPARPAARRPEPAIPDEAPDLSAPDWLEPVAPVPGDPAFADSTPSGVARDAVIDPTPSGELDLDLDEVVAEDTLPPTPPRARSAPAIELELAEPELAEPEALEPELAEPELADAGEPELGLDPDDSGFSLGALVDDDDEAALAQLGGEPEPEPEADLAPVRRTPPVARPAAAKSVSPAKPTPARPTPAKPAPATPAKAAPPKPSPVKPTPAQPVAAKAAPAARAKDDDVFDLRGLVDEGEGDLAALKGPAKDGDGDDLDALFDEIQIGDE